MAAASNFKQMMSCKKSLSLSLSHTLTNAQHTLSPVSYFSLQPEAVIKLYRPKQKVPKKESTHNRLKKSFDKTAINI